MAAIAAAALGSAVLFEVVLQHTDGSTSVIVTNLAYPLGDVLLLSAVAGVFALTGWKPDRTWGLIGAALLRRHDRRRDLPLPDGDGHATPRGRSSTRCGPRPCCCWPRPSGSRRATWTSRSPAGRCSRPRSSARLLGLAILIFDHFDRLNLLAVGLAAATLVAVAVRLVLDLPREHARSSGCSARVPSPTRSPASATAASSSTTSPACSPTATGEPRLLVIYDLDGFKLYNDTLRPPRRRRPADAARRERSPRPSPPYGSCYRLGGDEFCVLADVAGRDGEPFLDATVVGLSE